uniref:Putative ovule protein n=1 Tax=Solanum chacoense TaxID=4108 RepID=A0A0V0GQY6_SOLCH
MHISRVDHQGRLRKQVYRLEIDNTGWKLNSHVPETRKQAEIQLYTWVYSRKITLYRFKNTRKQVKIQKYEIRINIQDREFKNRYIRCIHQIYTWCIS